MADRTQQALEDIQDYFKELLDITKTGTNAMLNSDEKVAKAINDTLGGPIGTDRFRDMTDLYIKSAGARFGKNLGDSMKAINPFLSKSKDKDKKKQDPEGIYKLMQKIGALPGDVLKHMGSFYMRDGKSYLQAMMDYDQKIRDANLALGNSGQLSRNLQLNFKEGAQEVAKFGLFMEDVVDIQRRYNDELGTARSLRQDEFDIIAKISQGTGLSVENASETVAILERYGFSAENTIDAIENQVELSRKYGVNSLQTLTRTRDVIKTAQKFTFRDGINGLSEMVAQAQSLKMDIGDTFSMMDNARGLEGAFELATKLQMMGKDVDALRLNFLARNDPKQFQKEINTLMQGFGQLDRMGNLDLTPVDIDILREMSSITGQSVEDMKAQIVQQKRISRIRSEMRMISDEDAQFLANMSSMKDGKLVVQVAGGGLKEIDDVVQKDIDALKRMSAQNLEQSAMQSQGFQKQREVANATAIASILDGLDNIIANSDMLRKEREEAVKSLVDSYGVTEKSAWALASTFTSASSIVAEEAMKFTTNTTLKSSIAVIQEFTRGIGGVIDAQQVRDIKDGAKNAAETVRKSLPTNYLYNLPDPGNGMLYGSANFNNFTSGYSGGSGVVNDMVDSVGNAVSEASQKLNNFAEIMLKSAEKQNDSIKQGFAEALESVSGNWPIQTIKLLIDMQGREMEAKDVLRMLELYDQSKRSGTGN